VAGVRATFSACGGETPTHEPIWIGMPMMSLDRLWLPITAGGKRLTNRKARTEQPHQEPKDPALRGSAMRKPAGPNGTRRPLALLRLLDADCPSCRGLGCAVCYDTGLS